MNPPEAPNPEHRSSNALLCLGIGFGLMAMAWFFGLGGVIAAALSGGDPAVLAGGFAALIMLPLMALTGFVLALVGGIWLLVRVIADQSESDRSERYKNVQR